METLQIQTQDARTTYRPGETVEGTASWQLESPAKKIDLCLFWYTQGKGTSDVQVIDTVEFEPIANQGGANFRFTIPDSPWSFSGRLISLIWALELTIEPGDRSEKLELIVSPTGEEITLEPNQIPGPSR